MTQFESPYFAAIDLGSNSFHMLIARVYEGKVETVDREKQMVQIARGMRADGTLDEQSQERALTCLHLFSERLRDIPGAQMRAVGTKTLRAAKNSNRFLNAAESVLGVKIQIISGYEEARLVYAGLANTVTAADQRLVIDIGGGSTEFVVGAGFKPICLESLAMGCVSFSEKFILHSGGVTRDTMRKAYYAACAELEEIRKNYLKTGWDITYGTSGTMKAVADLLVEQDGGAVITRASLEALLKDTVANGRISSATVPKLRRDVLPAGLAILQAIFELLKIDKIHVADATLKDGLIYDTLGRFSDRDSRVETVAQLQTQYNIDRDHAERVRRAAKQFWSQIKGPDLPGVSRTKILSWAAQLHEIGLSISHSSYHHHGHYILRHSDLAGFGRYEQYVLANLVRLHRKKLADDRVAEGLDKPARQAFIPLLLCLRLAVLLHRRRENLDALPQLSKNNGAYVLSFPPTWLASHPLTLASLEQERAHFGNIGVNLAFETQGCL